MFQWAAQAVPLLVLLGGTGSLRIASASAANDSAPAFKVFAQVSPNMFSRAVPTDSNCSVDLVNDTAAQHAAVDHQGSASFKGWVGDKASGKVPATFWLVLDGTQDFYVQAHTGGDRPDVAAVLHNPDFARSGFQVNAYLPGIPVGDYGITIYYRIEGKEMVCPTHITVSVQ